MKVFRKELRKLLNGKLLVVLALFTIIYGYLFIGIAQGAWNYSNSPRDVDFHRELVAEFGPSLSPDEWNSFLEKRQRLIDSLMDVINKNPIMQKYGIDSYEKYCDEKYSQTTSEIEELRKEFGRLTFHDPITEPISFKLQVMNGIMQDRNDGFFFASNESANQFIANSGMLDQSTSYQQRMHAHLTTDSHSLIHGAVTETVDSDFSWMLILSAIWGFVLILPYQIGERLRGVRPIQLTTRTGRKCYGIQALVSAVAGLMIGLVLSVAYGVMLWRKGALDFLHCNINHGLIAWWIDLSYLQYLLIHLILLLLGTISAAMLAYLIGRFSSNYITGVGASIPSVAALCAGISTLGTKPLFMEWDHTALWSVSKLGGVLLICCACAAAVFAVLKRDRVRDIL